MIVSASRRTDIPAFYGEWFTNRLRAGYCKCVNPYNRRAYRVDLSPAAVDWMVRRKATCVLWNVVPGDWTDPDGWVDRALTDLETREHALVVLHDAVPDATKHLDAFVRAAKDRGHTFTDAWPDDCVPLRAGEPRPGLERYVAATAP